MRDQTHLEQPSGSLSAAGYIMAVLLPVVGFVVGVVLLVRNIVGHGIAVLVLSIVVFTVAVALLAGSGTYADPRAAEAWRCSACR